jgi:hypothetical protein
VPAAIQFVFLTDARGSDPGPGVCPECGSHRLREFAGYFGTGVFSPDGGEESHWHQGIECLACGYVEEL